MIAFLHFILNVFFSAGCRYAQHYLLADLCVSLYDPSSYSAIPISGAMRDIYIYIVHNLYLSCDVATSRSAHLKMCCWLVGCVQFYVGKHCRMCVRLFVSNCIMFFKMPKFIVYCGVYMNIKYLLLRFSVFYYKENTLKHNCYVKH